MEKEQNKLDDKEYMRTAMLKHEEIFRQQVYELHRLYQIQKILMNSYEAAQSTRQCRERWITDHQNNGSCNQVRVRECMEELNGHKIDEGELELTLGPPISKTMQRRTEKPSLSGQSLSSSSSTVSSPIVMRTMPQRVLGSGYVKASETGIGLGNGQDINLKQQPRWLLQALTLKLT